MNYPGAPKREVFFLPRVSNRVLLQVLTQADYERILKEEFTQAGWVTAQQSANQFPGSATTGGGKPLLNARHLAVGSWNNTRSLH
jgi:hypothetical protein